MRARRLIMTLGGNMNYAEKQFSDFLISDLDLIKAIEESSGLTKVGPLSKQAAILFFNKHVNFTFPFYMFQLGEQYFACH